jgi:electron transfer flavoprotein alpha subunit
MARTLVIAERDGRSIHVNTAKCVTCARAIAPDAIDVAVLGADLTAADDARVIDGVTRVIGVLDAHNDAPLSAILAPQIAALAGDYSHVLAPSSTFGKDLLPRVAALLGVGQVSDVMAVENPYRFKRPTYAGNAIITVEADADRCLLATVRTASFAAAGTQPPAPIDEVRLDLELPTHSRFVELAGSATGRADLQTAGRVVAGGRGLGSAERFGVIRDLADALGAAVGASRAAVDSGFAPNDCQVGQTGKIIAPDLYIAVGISGAIQHLTGIKDARTIVAINKDSTAPIFDVADLGLVADLFEVVPELTAKLAAKGSNQPS